MRQRNRRPTHPGLILRQEFLEPLGLSQREIADRMGYEVKTINRIINERGRVTARVALGLSEVLGTTAQFWLNLQNSLDLWEAAQEVKRASQTGA